MPSTQSDAKEYSYSAGGAWRKAADGKIFDVHEPYSGKLFARVAAGSRADARIAVDAAAKAFPAWADSTPSEKARLFLKASEIVRRRAKQGPQSHSLPSKWIWSRRRYSKSQVGFFCQKVKFSKQANRILIQSACDDRWAFAQASLRGMAPTSCRGELSSLRWPPEILS
jgi:hypothetical protein